MKKSLIFMMVLCITGCNHGRGFQPPPKGYEVFQGYHVHNDEIIKQDMRDCGFPNVYDENIYYNDDRNAYTQSNICMEQKGYIKRSDGGGICSINSFKSTEACQKYLNQK